MENPNSLLLKVSRLFPSSFNYSCNSRTLPNEVAHSSVIVTKSKKLSHFPRRAPEPEVIHSDADEAQGRKCPPASPVSTKPANQKHTNRESVDKKNRSSSSNNNSGQWFTSSDERIDEDRFETDTFYTSLSSLKSNIDEPSRASFSSGSDHYASTKTYYDSSRRRRRRRSVVMEEGLAVQRRSRDPYGDFMESMVEMIVEKGMFEAEDLDRLLSCFLRLNEVEYHGIIFQVFSEICQTLFCD